MATVATTATATWDSVAWQVWSFVDASASPIAVVNYVAINTASCHVVAVTVAIVGASCITAVVAS